MSSSESEIKARIRLAIGAKAPHCRLWNNPVGFGWAGDILRMGPNRTVSLINAYQITYGLAKPGGSDLIGFTMIEITPDMVGRRIAVFTAQEVKRPGEPVPDHQQKFIGFVRESGGIAGVVRSPEDSLALVRRPVVVA